MLEAPTRKRIAARPLWLALFAAAAATAFSSCATKEKPRTALINDPDAQSESPIPWNRPEKWETGAQVPAGLGGGGIGGSGSNISP